MTRTVTQDPTAQSKEAGYSARKRRAILDAATDLFLKRGYLGASMDEIATIAQVSKQTVYKQFSSKQALFVEVVSSMTEEASARVHKEIPELEAGGDVSEYLQMYAMRQLAVVLTPRLMRLRRLVIGEASRFPRLAEVLYERGPQSAMQAFARSLERLAARGLLAIDDPATAASHFNWLVMSAPLHRAMLLGDDAIPKPAALRRHAAEAVRTFLAAYGT